MTKAQKAHHTLITLGRACQCYRIECRCCEAYKHHLRTVQHLDITALFNDEDPAQFSASQNELGPDAGKITYGAAVAAHREHLLLADEDQRQCFKDWISDYGAWSEAEIESWSHAELNALAIQFVAGNIREAKLYPGMTDAEWKTYEQAARDGQVSGEIWRDGDSYYFSMER